MLDTGTADCYDCKQSADHVFYNDNTAMQQCDNDSADFLMTIVITPIVS